MTPRRHAFLVGCPRSGTTLLERMLGSHPQLASSSEAAVWHSAVWMPLLRECPGASGMRAVLGAMTPPHIESGRHRYWQNIVQTVEGDLADRLLLDKSPTRRGIHAGEASTPRCARRQPLTRTQLRMAAEHALKQGGARARGRPPGTRRVEASRPAPRPSAETLRPSACLPPTPSDTCVPARRPRTPGRAAAESPWPRQRRHRPRHGGPGHQARGPTGASLALHVRRHLRHRHDLPRRTLGLLDRPALARQALSRPSRDERESATGPGTAPRRLPTSD